MATTTVTGSEWLNQVSDSTADIPFRKYLTLGTLLSETWDSQTYDPGTGKIVFGFKSAEGSTFKFNSTNTGTDTNGADKGSLAIVAKSNGTNLSGTWANSWSDTSQKNSLNTSQSNALNLSWVYTGGTSSKEDDFKYKTAAVDKDNKYAFTDASGGGFRGIWSTSESTDFSNSDFSYSNKWIASGQSIWSNAVGKTIEDNFTSVISYSFKDIQNNIAFSLSGVKLEKDLIANSIKLEVGSMKYISSDYSVATAKFTKTLTVDEGDSYNLGSGAGDFSSISNDVRRLAAYLLQDNTITITATSGFEIDAASGNDTVSGGLGNDIISGGLGNDIITGGLGNDSIVAGAGKDKLTGGKGDDVYKISKSDYDFTSAKTVLADTIVDFKYTATEKDSILFDGFGDIDVFQTLALAKKAGSTANVIYESKTGNFWYNEDGDSALAGALLFANAKGISDTYWIAAGVM
jgi:Ca2+-binding RTX toxin-like protein